MFRTPSAIERGGESLRTVMGSSSRGLGTNAKSEGALVAAEETAGLGPKRVGREVAACGPRRPPSQAPSRRYHLSSGSRLGFMCGKWVPIFDVAPGSPGKQRAAPREPCDWPNSAAQTASVSAPRALAL